MAVTKFPGGLVVQPRPFPKAFNPSTATDKQLVSHGLPPRPKDPTLLLGWENLMERLRTTPFIEPEFQRTNRRHGPALHGPGTGGTPSPNWSGAVVVLPENAPAGADFFVVVGQWTMPNALPAANDSQDYICSSWIGIDGWFPGDSIIQAGVESDVHNTSSGMIAENSFAWWEWFPENPIAISNFAVSPGDSLTGVIVRQGPGANIIFSNNVKNTYTAFEAMFPTSTVVGHCAEWIVERPGNPASVLTQLANYGSVAFQEAWAGTNMAGSDAVRDPLLGFSVDMIGDNGSTVSHGSTASRQVNCFFV
jgi:hypothetical protein